MAQYYASPCDDGVIRARCRPIDCARRAKPWVLAATIMGSSMAMIDGTVVNVALPTFQREFSASATQIQWIIESYALMLASLILVGGALGDRFGRRRIFGIGIVIFIVASAACGLAETATQLIWARAVQGVGGALLAPASLAIISATFDEDERGKAFGTWSAVSAIAMALGPVFGGWLIEHVSWRWIFYINLPIGVIVLAILAWRVPESSDPNAIGLDVPGAVLAVAGLGGLTFGLIETARLGFGSAIVLGSLIGGALALAGFVFQEGRARFPMMPLGLFRSSTFSGTNLMTLFLYSALGGTLFFVPLNLIQVQGYSATAAGAAFLPLMIILFLFSRQAGALADRFGARPLLIIGPVVAGLGFALLSLPAVGGGYWTTFFPGIFVLAIGMSLSVTPLTTAVMGAVDQSKAGVASGVNNAVARTGGLIAVALFGVVMSAAFQGHLAGELAGLDLGREEAAAILASGAKLAAAAAPEGLSEALAVQVDAAIKEAFVSGFRAVIYLAVAFAFMSALCSWLFIGRDREPERALPAPEAATG